MIKHLLIPFFICTSVVFIYYPGLYGGFVFDDISNILKPVGIRMDTLNWDNLSSAAFSMDKRPLARVSFALNYFTSSFNPLYFKAINIGIHSINSILVYIFTFALLSASGQKTNTRTNSSRLNYIAIAFTLGWALHPVNLTNVLYVVQRMNSLSALFVLAAMVAYIKGRAILDTMPGKGWILIASSIALFLPLGWFSKENAALLPLFLLLIELTVFRFIADQKSNRIGLYLFFTLFLVLPALLATFYILQHPGTFHGGFINRHFSLIERLLTEPRVMWLYIKMILLPTPSVFGLFHDDIVVSTSLFKPVTTAFSIIGLAFILFIALFTIKRLPILAFGLLFFLAGHLMESTFIPLEIAFEHRNYLPSIGLLLPLFYYIGRAPSQGTYIKTRIATMAIIILIFALLTHLRAWTWSDNSRLYLTEAQYHPGSPRANYEAGKVFGQMLEQGRGDPERNYREAVKYFERVTSLRYNTTSGLFGIILASTDAGKKIQPHWVQQLEYRLRYYPLEQVNLIWLDRITDCIIQGECRAEDMQIKKLAYAAINNKHSNARNTAMIYNTLAKYASQVQQNKYNGLKMSRKAVSLQPSNLYYRINLANHLIIAGNKREAAEVLLTASKMDIHNQFTDEISQLKSNL